MNNHLLSDFKKTILMIIAVLSTFPLACTKTSFFMVRPSQSSAIAISQDDSIVVMTNENGSSVTVFDATVDPPTIIAEVPVGKEPVAVVITPDGTTAFVANQADATVSKIINLKSEPQVEATVEVGSEPVGLALSPSGNFLYVSELVQGRVSKWETAFLNLITSTSVPFPFGIAVTTDLDTDDNDETVIVSQFYGNPINTEGQDNSRQGVVHLLNASDLSSSGTVNFEPRSSGIQAQAGGILPQAAIPNDIIASPNQLYAVAVEGQNFFVPTISASPARNVAVRGGNLHPIILAGNLTNKSENTGLSVNLEKMIQDLLTTEDGRRNFLSGSVSLSVSPSESTPDQTVIYVASRGGDAIQRILYNVATNFAFIDVNEDGKPDQIDLFQGFQGCRTPVGIAIARNTPKAFVNCRGTRRLAIVDLGSQTLSTTLNASTPPAEGTKEFDIERGQLLFFTARARWSVEARSDCAACHANGPLSDNITWIFPAGPRKTVPMHWTYHDQNGDGVKETQRILNWSAIFDELRDFEGNITNVSGGKGVFTLPNDGDKANNCASLATQGNSILDADKNGLIVAVNNNNTPPPPAGDIDELLLPPPEGVGFNDIGLSGSAIELENQFRDQLCAPNDWKEVDAYTAALRTPRARKTFGDSILESSITNGRNLFVEARCFACHGGPGWTSSRLFYDVTRSNTSNTTGLASETGGSFGAFNDAPLVEAFGALADNQNTRHIQTEGGTVGPPQVSCVLRNVGTFGDPNDAAITSAVEIKNGDGAIAQGQINGFNVPPVLGLAVEAPYFHHGLAKTLDELLTDTSWQTHLKAANPNFALATPQQVEDLKNYLLSIDATTEAFNEPVNGISSPVDNCP